jgi:hypothetical protein
VVDRDGIKLLLEPSSRDRLPRLTHLWLDAGYNGKDKGAGWVEGALGWTAEIVRHPLKPAPEEVMMRWVREWAKVGVALDPKELLPPEVPRPFLPRRWIVERCGAHLFLVGSEQEDEQGLRASAGDRRSPHLRSDESPDGKALAHS